MQSSGDYVGLTLPQQLVMRPQLPVLRSDPPPSHALGGGGAEGDSRCEGVSLDEGPTVVVATHEVSLQHAWRRDDSHSVVR